MKNITPSEKNFGLTFSVIFFLIAIYFLYKDKTLSVNLFVFLFISICFLLISIMKPKLLFWPNLIWFKFGEFLSKIFTPIILFILFLFGVGITRIFYLVFAKKNKLNSDSNFILKDKKMTNFDLQF
jgi:hypothetical protein